MVNKYHNSVGKWLFDKIFSLGALLFALPLILLIGVVIALTSGFPVFFVQKRTGKNGKTFRIIKFRTMIKNADKLKQKYKSLNESDGVAFKIKNDPRFTFFGRYLSRTGLDELPQFINVLKGDMSIVGPRPLPVQEATKLTKTQKKRWLIKPGITSSWVINGAHTLSFKKWIELDLDYIKKASFKSDIIIVVKTVELIVRYVAQQLSFNAIDQHKNTTYTGINEKI